MMESIKPSALMSNGSKAFRKKYFKKNNPKKRFVIWSIISVSVLIFILVMPYLAKYDPYEINLTNTLFAPTKEHILGTDYLGRDVLSRILVGGRRSVYSALLVVLITASIGTVIGVLCGFFGGIFDTIVMRITDSFQAFPTLIFTIAVAAILGGGLFNAIIAMSVIGWTSYARLARSNVMTIKEKTYVKASIITGYSKAAVLFKVILPNAISGIIVMASMNISNCILAFAGLSFLGLGTQRPFPEWGGMLNDGQETLQLAPWCVIYPGIAIFIIAFIMGMFGDSVNELLNPNKKK